MCREPKPRGQRRSGAAIAVALLVIAANAGSAQAPVEFAAYRQLIDEYRAGRRVADGDISRLTSDQSMVGRAVEPASGWSAVDLSAAAMLHTDLALLIVKKARQPEAAVHIDAATTLLSAKAPTSSTGMRSADIQSSTVWVSSSGTMIPPTPSMKVMPRR